MEIEKKWLDTINEMSGTIKALAVEKDKKNSQQIQIYKTIILRLVIAIIVITIIYASAISYFIYNIYNYDYSVTNTNVNKNTNQNGGMK